MTENTPAIHTLLDSSARDALAVKNLDLVSRVVGRLPISLPHGIDRDDLLSAGTVGLLNAARTYQPMRGASFRTFAYLAIKAAVLDELRRHDPLPRGARARIRELERVESEARSTLGRVPTPDEIAQALSLDTEGAEELIELAKEARFLVREQSIVDEDGRSFEAADESASEPGDDAAKRELLAKIEDAICDLSQRERQVFVLYHSENLYLKEIGALLDVTESRVSQILACAERKIRSRVERSGGRS